VREQLAHAQRRIKGGEREAQAARRRAAEHAAKLAALREQLEGLEDGEQRRRRLPAVHAPHAFLLLHCSVHPPPNLYACCAPLRAPTNGPAGCCWFPHPFAPYPPPSCRAARRTVEEEIEESRRGRLDLSPALLEEYNAIKRTVGAATAALEADRAALATAADADGEALRLLRDARGAAASRAADLAAAAAADGARLAALGAAREAAAAERAAAAAERERLTDERRRVDARRGTLETRLAAADAELRELKATKKESAREAARRQLVADLRREHPGKVFGAVTDLGEPTAQKYRLAMAVVMGKDFDSVVVDSPETAMACIRAVKARRLPPVTFLPADTIRVKEVPPALRALGGSARLAIDCLHVEEPGARRAFAAVCGATLLCDTAAEAREVAFGGGEVRHKVVALDGTAFLKTGLITGGMTDQMEARAQKWDEQRVAEAKRERDAAAAALAATPTLRELTEALQAAEAAAARLENAERFAAADAKATAAKVKEGEEQVAALQRVRARECVCGGFCWGDLGLVGGGGRREVCAAAWALPSAVSLPFVGAACSAASVKRRARSRGRRPRPSLSLSLSLSGRRAAPSALRRRTLPPCARRSRSPRRRPWPSWRPRSRSGSGGWTPCSGASTRWPTASSRPSASEAPGLAGCRGRRDGGANTTRQCTAPVFLLPSSRWAAAAAGRPAARPPQAARPLGPMACLRVRCARCCLRRRARPQALTRPPLPSLSPPLSSRKIGVASVREYEDTALAGAERLARQRLEVGAQAARVRAQAEYEAQADPGAEAAAKEAEVAALREQVAALEQVSVQEKGAGQGGTDASRSDATESGARTCCGGRGGGARHKARRERALILILIFVFSLFFPRALPPPSPSLAGGDPVHGGRGLRHRRA
jgi:hypothetical protein